MSYMQINEIHEDKVNAYTGFLQNIKGILNLNGSEQTGG